MSKTIVQKIIFKNTSPKVLYELYMDEKKHAKVTGSPAKITATEGSEFMAYDGYITGKNLQLVKDKLIVQSWRGSDWKKEDMDSTFIIHLIAKNKDFVLHAIHANVPKKQFDGIKKGWHKHYWDAWKKQFIAAKQTSKKAKPKNKASTQKKTTVKAK